jgi:hypothetical protein
MKKSYHSIIVPVAEPTITLNKEFVPAKEEPGADSGADWIAIDRRPRGDHAQLNRGSFNARRLGRKFLDQGACGAL